MAEQLKANLEGVKLTLDDSGKVLTLDPGQQYDVDIEKTAPMYKAWREQGATEIRSRNGTGYVITFAEPVTQDKASMIEIFFAVNAYTVEAERNTL